MKSVTINKRSLLVSIGLVAILAGTVPALGMAAGLSDVSASHCAAPGYAIPYPTVSLDSDPTYLAIVSHLASYAIPYPTADLDGNSQGCQAGNNPTMSGATRMAFPFKGLNPRGPVADTSTFAGYWKALEPGRLNPQGPVANSAAASVELMAFPFEGLNPGRPVAKSTAAAEARALLPVTRKEAVELMAFPFEGLSPRGPVADTSTFAGYWKALEPGRLNAQGPVANSIAATQARAERTALTGTEQRFFGVPDRVWAADGLTQIRGLQLSGHFAFSGAGITLAGEETQVSNATLDAAAGHGHTWGVVTYTDAATGVTCTGPVVGEIKNFLATLTVVAPCSDGTLLKGTVQDKSTDPPGQAPPVSVMSDFNGVLLSPGQN